MYHVETLNFKAMRNGRPYKYNADQLHELIYGENGYFAKIANEPFYKYDVVKTGQDAGKELKIKIDQMPTIEGLTTHVDVTRKAWYEWVAEAENGEINGELEGDELGDRKKFLNIVIRATYEIQDKQISGAGAGLFQPMIVARLNRLKDTQEIEQTNIDATNKNEDEIRAAMEAIRNARKK